MAEAVIRKSLKNLLSQDKYIIPLYQRNYAWERDEIFQLLQDINESSGTYYIGTLVISTNNNGQMQLIDGQQRFTTLSIVNSVFKSKGKSDIAESNLLFEARYQSQQTIEHLHLSKDKYEEVKQSGNADVGVQNIIGAVNYIEEYIREEETNNKDFSLESFVNRFYNDIEIFRAEVPKDTDLNHYFEIMNNRGEQLEKHEILKAAFLEKITKSHRNIYQQNLSKIWEACSQMNGHVQKFFESGERNTLFGDNYNDTPTKESLLSHDSRENEKGGNSLSKILSSHELSEKFNQGKTEDYSERFSSVINFSNFLLLVLQITTEKNVRLDDKYLLEEFDYPNIKIDPIDFIYNLLRCRILFDKFIVKREGDRKNWSWSIKKAYNSKSSDNAIDYKLTFGKDNEESNYFSDKLVMIQSMFEVTFSTNTYKTWLLNTLVYLFKSESTVNGEQLLKYFQGQASKYYQDNGIGHHFDSGLSTPRFLFNYTDYLLWCLYYDNIRGGNSDKKYEDPLLNKISKEKKYFNSFRFVQRSSIEHLFPQSRYKELHAPNDDEKEKVLNMFGNLCLISRSSNSAYSANMPYTKKHDSIDKNESLKQKIMFASFDAEWNTKEIEEHHKEIIKIIPHA